jgi:hypothetical protein
MRGIDISRQSIDSEDNRAPQVPGMASPWQPIDARRGAGTACAPVRVRPAKGPLALDGLFWRRFASAAPAPRPPAAEQINVDPVRLPGGRAGRTQANDFARRVQLANDRAWRYAENTEDLTVDVDDVLRALDHESATDWGDDLDQDVP